MEGSTMIFLLFLTVLLIIPRPARKVKSTRLFPEKRCVAIRNEKRKRIATGINALAMTS